MKKFYLPRRVLRLFRSFHLLLEAFFLASANNSTWQIVQLKIKLLMGPLDPFHHRETIEIRVVRPHAGLICIFHENTKIEHFLGANETPEDVSEKIIGVFLKIRRPILRFGDAILSI